VFADRQSLADALMVAGFSAPTGVVVGYSAAGGLRVNKQPVATAWGRGEGVAVLRLDDLGSLLGGADGPVGIESLPENWRGWPAGRDQHAPARTFRYFEADSNQ